MSLVNIIMTCHNGEKYIETAINILLNQTYKNWQLIFYNNSSNDRSLEIVESFQDARINCFTSNKLLNLGQIRKLAIELCKGEYICFLDVDDYWKNNKIEKQIEKFQKNNSAELVYSNFYLIKESINSKRINYFYKGICPKKVIESYINGNPLTAWLTVMVKTSSINELEYSFDEKLHISSDMDFFIRLCQYCYIDYVEDYLAYYRIHNDNESKKQSKQVEELAYICDKYQNNKEIRNLLNQRNFSDTIFIKNILLNKISRELRAKYKTNIKSLLYKFIYSLVTILPKNLLQMFYKIKNLL